METEFTPLLSAIGGCLIGLSAVALMYFHGRIFGATGILAGLLAPSSAQDFSWRVAVVAGMISGPIAVALVTGSLPDVDIPVSSNMLVLGGLIVGIGVTLGSGCTSGHGICGLARFSPRSLHATITFMIFTFISVYSVRHILGL
ncbi:membrane protein [Amylibacter marinus]|uniref:Membrane protein n=1 Tax=Amylibacter marinus TaxID=1475483 RepID=A0ABQ5VYI4_9RHOB|nr:YeeE/YedE family protein [Amylibacter marinus]GLQ36148.1 membrane protein [Amylibacter marinus]